MAGVLLAIAYGVVAAPWLATAGPALVVRVPDWAAGVAGPLGLFLIGPGWLWMLPVSQLRPRRLKIHYALVAMLLNMLGNTVLLAAVATHIATGRAAG